MTNNHLSHEYPYRSSAPSFTGPYLWPQVTRLVESALRNASARRVFELGCGNGSFAATLQARGIETVGVDPSSSGIAEARKAVQRATFEQGSTEDDLAGLYGRFPVVVSLEVVEHVYLPRQFASRLYDLLEPGGTAIISTPYHGYLKNLALAITGRMDAHFTALWDYGHIKFWSPRTLQALLIEAGFQQVSFDRVGRVPPFAKSMIAIATKK